MKKIIYLLLALVLLAGVAFLLSNTKLLKGAFSDGKEVPVKIPGDTVVINEEAKCVSLDLLPDQILLTEEEVTEGKPLELSIQVEMESTVASGKDPSVPTWSGILRIESSNGAGSFMRVDDPTRSAAAFESSVDSVNKTVQLYYQDWQIGDSVQATLIKPSGTDCKDTVTLEMAKSVAPPEPENQAPLALDDTAEVDQGLVAIIDVLANDSDSDGLIDPSSVSIVDSPLNGSTSINPSTGVVSYSPNAESNFVGSDVFTYIVADEDGSYSSPARVSIEVRAPLSSPAAPVVPNVVTPSPEVIPNPNDITPSLSDLYNPNCTDEFADTRNSDGSNKWYTAFTCNEFALGIIEGRRAGFFVPNDEVSVAEFLKMLLLTADVDVEAIAANSDVSFPDVKQGKWYTNYMIAAEELGLFQKPEGAPGRPNDDVTRREIFVWTARLFDLTLENFNIGDYCTDVSEFDTGAYAIAALMQIEVDVPGEGQGTGLTTVATGLPDGRCDLDGTSDRSEVAALVMRMLLAPELGTLELDEEALRSL